MYLEVSPTEYNGTYSQVSVLEDCSVRVIDSWFVCARERERARASAVMEDCTRRNCTVCSTVCCSACTTSQFVCELSLFKEEQGFQLLVCLHSLPMPLPLLLNFHLSLYSL